MSRRVTRKEGDPCPKCSKSISGGNVVMRGPKRTQIACAACHDSYHRVYMADTRRYQQAIDLGHTMAAIRAGMAADPQWLDKLMQKTRAEDRFWRARGDAKREIEAGCTPERKAELQAEFNGKTYETWNGR